MINKLMQAATITFVLHLLMGLSSLETPHPSATTTFATQPLQELAPLPEVLASRRVSTNP